MTTAILPYRKNLVTTTIYTGDISERADYHARFETKEKLQNAAKTKTADLTYIAACYGKNPQVSMTASRNPPAKLAALIIDVDPASGLTQLDGPDPIKVSRVCEACGSIPPTWMSESYSGGLRMVWMLGYEIPVSGSKMATSMMIKLANNVGAKEFIDAWTQERGIFDQASFNPHQYFEKGDRWTQTGDIIPDEELAAAVFDLGPEAFGEVANDEAIPFEAAAEECQKRWPDMWGTRPFEPGQTGCTFWLPEFKNTVSAKVDEAGRGMVTFTTRAPKRFYTWRDILGDKWADSMAKKTMDEVLSDFAFVGSTPYLKLHGEMIPVSLPAFNRALRRVGFATKEQQTQAMDAIDRMRTVRAVVSVYGSEVGRVVDIPNFGRVITSSSSKLLEPSAEKDPDNVLRLLTTSFGDKQLPYFLSWLKVYYEGLREVIRANGDMSVGSQGHALYLLGSPGGGKTVITKLLTKIVGGAELAERYLTGQDKFNSELAGAPLWILDDVMPPRDGKLVNSIKEAVAAGQVSVRGMNKDAYRFPWRGRVVVCANDDPDTFEAHFPKSFLPIIRDKVHVHKIAPPPADIGEIVNGALDEENIRKFLNWLEDYEIPEALRSPRFGVKEYIHTDMLADAEASSYEAEVIQTLNIWVENGLNMSKGSPRLVTARDIFDEVLSLGKSTGFKSAHNFSIMLAKVAKGGTLPGLKTTVKDHTRKYSISVE